MKVFFYLFDVSFRGLEILVCLTGIDVVEWGCDGEMVVVALVVVVVVRTGSDDMAGWRR